MHNQKISLCRKHSLGLSKEIEVLTNKKEENFDTTYVNDMTEDIKSDIEYYTKLVKAWKIQIQENMPPMHCPYY